MGWHYLSIPKLQWLHRWSWEWISNFILHFTMYAITYHTTPPVSWVWNTTFLFFFCTSIREFNTYNIMTIIINDIELRNVWRNCHDANNTYLFIVLLWKLRSWRAPMTPKINPGRQAVPPQACMIDEYEVIHCWLFKFNGYNNIQIMNI